MMSTGPVISTRRQKLSKVPGASPASCDLSLVIPVYNEAENLAPLLQEINAALAQRDVDYEVVFVDDGSWDGSFDVMRELARNDARVVAIRFRRGNWIAE